MGQTARVTGGLLIGGQIVGTNGDIRAVDPASGQEIEPAFVVARETDVDQACRLATEAFDIYRATGLEERAAFLEKIADNILELGDTLIERAHFETGLSVPRLETERARTVFQLRLFAKVVRSGEWQDVRIEPAMEGRQPFRRPDLRLRQVALGPVAVFGSSNFPLAFSAAGGDTASALAAGCPVVVKGHLAHPGTGELVGQAVQAAVRELGLPEGVYSLLNGTNDTGGALVRHPAIKAVGFTGSRIGGLALMKIAFERPEPIPVYAEMSSINPVYLMPGALKERAESIARGFTESLTLGAGQFCTNPGLMFAVDGPDLDAFVAAASQSIGQVEPQPMLTPNIHAAFDRGVEALSQHDGLTRVAESKPANGPNRSPAVFFEVDADYFRDHPKLAEEVFGASSVLVRCQSLDQMIELSEALEGQLTATLHVAPSDYEDTRKLIPVLERKVGRILANGWPTGVEVSPAMVHGGPFPATSDSKTTSVGTMAIRRFLRPVSYQDLPADLLPDTLRG